MTGSGPSSTGGFDDRIRKQSDDFRQAKFGNDLLARNDGRMGHQGQLAVDALKASNLGMSFLIHF